MEARLDPASDRPAYKQIADILHESIRTGELAPGTKLPSESALIDKFGVAQGTVRQALNLLRGEGLVQAQQGRGVFVRERPPIRRVASDRFQRRHRQEGQAAYLAESEAEQVRPRMEVYYVGPAEAPTDVATRLGLAQDAKVLIRRRRYFSDEHPTELATSYVPWSLAEGTQMTQENPGPGGIYARMEEAGYSLAHFREEVSARMPTPEEAKALLLTQGMPVMTLVRTAYAEGEIPVEVCDTVMTADLYLLDYDIPAR